MNISQRPSARPAPQLLGRMKHQRAGMLSMLAMERHRRTIPAPPRDGGPLAKGPTKVGNAAAGILDDHPVEVLDVVGIAAADCEQIVGFIPSPQVADRAGRALE